MSVARTNEIRPGYAFDVIVTEDLLVSRPFDDAVRP
jgi:type IV secretory pathway VirB10-like protein